MQSVPLFVPGVLLAISLALVAAPALGRRLGLSRAHAALLIIAVGAVFAATVTPQQGALSGIEGSGRCSFTRWLPAPLHVYLAGGDVEGNVLLFLPLGAAIGLVRRGRLRLGLLGLGLLLPVGIETFQLLVPALDRACESADVVDNVLGLLIGFAGARIASFLVGIARRRPADATGEQPS